MSYLYYISEKTPGNYRMTQREWFIEMTKFKFKFLRQLQACKFWGDKHNGTAVKFVSKNCNLRGKCLMINFKIRAKFEPFWIICNDYTYDPCPSVIGYIDNWRVFFLNYLLTSSNGSPRMRVVLRCHKGNVYDNVSWCHPNYSVWKI